MKVQSLEKSSNETNNELKLAKEEIVNFDCQIKKMKEEKEKMENDYQKKINVNILKILPIIVIFLF